MDPNDVGNLALSKTTIWQNRKALVYAILMMSVAFQFGFDYGTIGGCTSLYLPF
jgi:hypothetical protein